MPAHIERADGGDGMTSAGRARALRVAAPVALGIGFLAVWQAFVFTEEIPAYVLPGPLLIAETLWRDGPSLLASLWVTLRITLVALAAAAVIGGALAILFAQSRLLEISLFPYAIILQVTPIVAIAPLIIIWLKDDLFLFVVVCAWIVAFFPIVANTTLGLNSADRNLADLFRLYRASRWQTLRYLRVPTALPYFLGGLRISGGLSLIGAVVAEFVAGTGGRQTGLASRIMEAGYRLQVARQFAALFLLALTGIAIFAALSWLTRRLIGHWHESVLAREE
jgi:NitT/TauT family transport system permease protein